MFVLQIVAQRVYVFICVFMGLSVCMYVFVSGSVQ